MMIIEFTYYYSSNKNGINNYNNKNNATEAIVIWLYSELLLCHIIQKCVQNLSLTIIDLYKTNIDKGTQDFVYKKSYIRATIKILSKNRENCTRKKFSFDQDICFFEFWYIHNSYKCVLINISFRLNCIFLAI